MQNKSGTPASALWTAAYSGNFTGVRRLIAEGVDVNVWDQFGRGPLTFAALRGHLDIAHELVRAGAWIDPHEDYDCYDSPLMCAAIRGDKDMVEFLLSAGADPTLHVGRSQQTAESHARELHPKIAALLRRSEDEKQA